MNEEEKQAIEFLNEQLDKEENDDFCPVCLHNYLVVVLDLIKRQQKEIEKYEQQIDLEFVEKNFIEKNKVVSKDKIREKLKEARKINWHTPKLVIEYFEELLEEN